MVGRGPPEAMPREAMPRKARHDPGEVGCGTSQARRGPGVRALMVGRGPPEARHGPRVAGRGPHEAGVGHAWHNVIRSLMLAAERVTSLVRSKKGPKVLALHAFFAKYLDKQNFFYPVATVKKTTF